MSSPAAQSPTILIRPDRGWVGIGWRELWEYRELLYFLVWRDVRVRYKQVEYRDVRYAVPFLAQFWLFATPVAYPSSLSPEPWRTLPGLNPMVGVVEGFRWALLGTNPPGAMLAVSVLVALGLLVSGALYFQRVEESFANLV